jgi:hypothetical protein
MRFRDELEAEYTGTTKTTYLYRIRDTGELVGVKMACGEKLARETTGGFIVLPAGEEAVRAFQEELAKDGFKPRQKTRCPTAATWPMTTILGGVNPEQIPELRSLWQERGVTGCDVLPNGDVVWESRQARKKDCEARGLFDRDGGYGDAQPRYA